MDIDILSESDVTANQIRQLFRNAFMKAEIDEDGDVRVHTDAGLKVIVSVDDSRKMLKYMAIYGLKEDAPDYEKHTFVNTLNDNVIFVRFSVPRTDILMADYFLSYEEGIPAYQIVNTARIFSRVVLGSVSEYDENDLVE